MSNFEFGFIIAIACTISAILGGTVVWLYMAADFVVKVDDLQREAHE